ncbi:DEAD/DEAH box helicase [Burkholderia vietnamiensis]|uniref:DEAD/DEAH box helicase n=1 Tax=Burkholderia vietnamiensis TaxID=60552 RepID=UPI001CAB4C59|nr:DEAD/DEAH box helicase [Burkholderia vietnamiensis]CAG9234910.1 DEAD/DEAH box helicase [Burkholderia vietnamiensis]
MRLSTNTIADLFRFDCDGKFGASESMVRMQVEGVTALCKILRRRKVAYLADEVGLGKTMQALGVVGWYRHINPNARILIITPRENVQNGWKREFERFHRYVGKSIASLREYARLRDCLEDMQHSNDVHLLRHPSFMRPLFIGGSEEISWLEAISKVDLPAIDTLLRAVPASGDTERSLAYNVAFAKAVNAWFIREGIRFDLVVVDEAQCLRNASNQTNTVLRTLLHSCVDHWLFMSATPAHSGVENIATLFNTYPGRGNLIDPDSIDPTDDFRQLKSALRQYMIRRPRTYIVGETTLRKQDYRRDDQESLSLTCQSALDTLSISLVQKHLVDVLEKQGNRFRTGYMASFESLDDSLRRKKASNNAKKQASYPTPADEDSERADFYIEANVRTLEAVAPDTGYVSSLSRDFESRFGFSLPHPKLDKVESALSLLAFGERNGDRKGGRVGGSKTLVFCRRISSVTALRQRLMQRYLSSIEERCREVWGLRLNWKAGLPTRADRKDDDMFAAGSLDDESGNIESDNDNEADDTNHFRMALRPGEWLHRFRKTFDDGYRHALIFEQNWFVRLCEEAGVAQEAACDRIPEPLWAESYAYAVRGARRQRRRQFRYLVWHCLNRHAREVFRFDDEQADYWRGVLRHVYPEDVYKQVQPDALDGREDRELMLFESLWARAESCRWAESLALPAWKRGAERNNAMREELLWRQVLSNVLGRYLRLTDALLDLYCADHHASETTSMLDKFMGWLCSDDIDAFRLRGIWHDWVRQYTLIFSSAIGETQDETLEARASQESFEFLGSLDPVVGITGGSRGHKRPIQQFNTPGMPWIMVGTDAIREGVNLHLYCDRVMHYGLAWTPGDLEQRVGRVDRYFSKIERRLKTSTEPMPTLEMLYPHLRDTLERRQIDVVMEKKRQSDAVTGDNFSDNNVADGDDAISLDVPLPKVLPLRQSLPEHYFGTARHLGDDSIN